MAHHPSGEAAAAPAEPGSVEDVYAALDEYLGGGDPDEEEPEEADDDADDAPEDADDGEADEDDSEPVEPAIAAPASLTAEEKDRYAQLPGEAQQFVAELETRRNAQVQQATTKAAEAQRAADAAAADAEATAKAKYAEQYRAFASQYAPQPPDPRLAQDDPARYVALNAQYQTAAAQHYQLMQQIDGLATEAEQHFAQQRKQWEAEQVRELQKLPDFADPAKRPAFVEALAQVGAELGYDESVMREAGAQDFYALKKALEWKTDAEKWRAAQSVKMQRVRDAKTAKPGVGTTNTQRTKGRRDAAWDRVKTTRDAGAMADWLEASGIL